MEIGIYTFGELTSDAVTPEQRLADLIEEIELADTLGLDVFAVGEHHRPDFAVSAPAVVLGTAAGRTEKHPAVQRGERPQLGRPRPRVPAVLDPGPPEPRARGDHGRARLVHRVLPPLRLRPRGLRRALRREARAAPADPRVRARDVERPAPGADREPPRLPAPRAGPAPGLGRGRRQPAVRGPRRRARPPARAGDHRRHARALRPGRRDPSPRGRGDGPPAPGHEHQLPRLHRRHVAGRRRRVLPGLRRDDGPDRPRARLAAA